VSSVSQARTQQQVLMSAKTVRQIPMPWLAVAACQTANATLGILKPAVHVLSVLLANTGRLLMMTGRVLDAWQGNILLRLPQHVNYARHTPMLRPQALCAPATVATTT